MRRLYLRRRPAFKRSSLTSSTSLRSPIRPVRREQPVKPFISRVSTLTTSAEQSSDVSPDLKSPSNGSAAPTDPPPDREPVKTTTTRAARSVKNDSEAIPLPDDLDILWTPVESSHPSKLPPPELLQEALNHLHICLHPKTQHRAAHRAQAPEPTLALYCPIEGGDYVLDATVGELAYRTGSDVVVLDSIQLAAGEFGIFGQAGKNLQFTGRNPLHFSATPATPTLRSSETEDLDEDDESPGQESMMPQIMTLLPSNIFSSSSISSSSKRSKPTSKTQSFFEAIVNISPKSVDSAKSKSRIIYIRDFATLAASAASWYPHLVAAVFNRRRGPLPRSTSPVANAVTIIFGISPSITPPSFPLNSSPSLTNLFVGGSAPAPPSPQNAKFKVDWGESEAAEKAREHRLGERLKKWDNNTLLEDLPKLPSSEENQQRNGGPGVVILGIHSGLSSLSRGMPNNAGISSSSDETNSSFFRTSVIVPRARAPIEEKAARMARRREINELTMRMAVGAVGGVLESGTASPVTVAPSDEQEAIEPTTEHVTNVAEGYPTVSISAENDPEESSDVPTLSNQERMWEDWGKRVEIWTKVRQVADHAFGTVMSDRVSGDAVRRPNLEATLVPWSAVFDRWASSHSVRDIRRSWMKEAMPALETAKEDEEVVDYEESFDQTIEGLKNNSDLDTHEQKLLPCIVDPRTLPTSFEQVHLPEHTIDSVRTIVSLPLLYPSAFQEGILKEHGMSGCLLFGPPGTGKTLVVRALAKEAGCRMLVISPSDVRDMYVGEGEKLVRAVFSLARRLSPCVVFIDEIDSLFGARSSGSEAGSALAHRGVITEFMQEMDGLKTNKDTRVIVIGATNRPFDLDDAVLRRLPRRLLVDLPGVKEREAILKILLRGDKLSGDVDIQSLAKRTEAFSGSDLKHLCVSAALDAVKEHVQLPWMHRNQSDETVPPVIKETADLLPAVNNSDNSTPTLASTQTPTNEATASLEAESTPVRLISERNFLKALKEITPSSSETLGSLAGLRKWNNEFGEGRRERKKQVWGRDRFGFGDTAGNAGPAEEGRVLPSKPSSS